MTEDFTTLPWKCGMKMTVKSGWITLDWDILQKNSEVVVSNVNLLPDSRGRHSNVKLLTDSEGRNYIII